MTETASPQPAPEIRHLSISDVMEALKLGARDFARAPAFGLFFGGIFSLTGIVIFAQLVIWQSSYWVLPVMAGFPLIGPFAAVGLYDVSRRLAAGEPLDWAAVISVVAGERRRQIPSMAFVALFFFLIWVYFAHIIFALSFGLKPLTNVMSSPAFLLSSEGVIMLIAGSIVGGALALALFSVSVIAVPLVLDREIDVVSAMVTSVRVVLENKAAMAVWAIIIAVLSALALAPFFLGMLVIFPILGHTSWHLYCRAVEPLPG